MSELQNVNGTWDNIPSTDVLSKLDLRDYKLGIKEPVDYPETYTLFPRCVKDQGVVGSCVAFAMASILEYYEMEQNGQYVPMSVGYLYGNREETDFKKPGYVIRDMLKTAKKWGCPPEVIFPYYCEMPDMMTKFDNRDADVDNIAKLYRISSYCRLHSIEEIKYAIYIYHAPVIMAMNWYRKPKTTSGGILTFESNERNGSHCMFIYGWNENGWLVQNSYGKDWGDDGCCVVPYSTDIREFWAVFDEYRNEKITYKKPNLLFRFIQLVINEFVNLISTFKNKKE